MTLGDAMFLMISTGKHFWDGVAKGQRKMKIVETKSNDVLIFQTSTEHRVIEQVYQLHLVSSSFFPQIFASFPFYHVLAVPMAMVGKTKDRFGM